MIYEVYAILLILQKLGTYAYPLFSSLPVPSQYIKNASRNYTTGIIFVVVLLVYNSNVWKYHLNL